MNLNESFAIAKPHVVADEVDGEVIAINLENGAYFSFRGSGSTIWQRLLSGEASGDELVERLRESYAGERREMAEAVAAFLARLSAEGLIVAVDAPPSRPAARAEGDREAPREKFVAPTIEKFTDMEEFLLVDPIHEIDVRQWPKIGKGD